MTNTVKFAELLIAFRGRYGWSQSELGEKVGVHRNTVANWKSGTIPSRGMVLRIADELQLSKEERNAFLKAAGYSRKHWPADYWNVPYKHNPYFIGREDILQSLRQRLIPGAKTTALTQSINGLGGIGKTQIAVEYAHRYGEYYTAVLWIQADSQEVATAACLQLATKVLGLPEQQEAEKQIDEVKHWLQKRHSWLLIFDNAEDPEVILSTFVPSKHQGSVLITTRKRDAGTLVHNEMLPLFSEDEAILFLLRRASRIGKSTSVIDETSNDFFLAKELCQLLGHLPLALDQAGAYIAENGSTLKNYIDLYHKYRPTLLDRRNAKTQQGSQSENDHPDSVFMTFWLSWKQIQKRKALAGNVLQFCAFLAPDRILESLVQAGISMLEVTMKLEELEMDEALGLLYRYSLIERTEQMLSLHRLVQEVIQEVLSEEECQQWMERAIRVVNAAFPSGEHATWPECETFLPHALVCEKWTAIVSHNTREGVHLLSATGSYLYKRGQYREAEPLLKRSLSIREEQLGATHPDTATCLNNLAELYFHQGRYTDAEPLYQRSLSIREEQLGATHPKTATCLSNLAVLYENQGRYTDAEPLYQRAVIAALTSLGMKHPGTQHILEKYLTLLSLLYPNGVFQLLVQRQESNTDEEAGPE